MQLNFDATQYEPTQGNSIQIPLGEYPMECTATEAKQVKDKADSGYLELTWTVLEGQYKGCNQPQRFNLWNSSEQAVRIAYGQLSAVCHAVGRLQIADSNSLVGGKALVTVGPQANNEKYSEVKHVKTIDGREPGQQAPAAPSGPPAPTAAPAAPWGTPAAPPAPAAPAAPSGPPAPVTGGWSNNAPATPPWGK